MSPERVAAVERMLAEVVGACPGCGDEVTRSMPRRGDGAGIWHAACAPAERQEPTPHAQAHVEAQRARAEARKARPWEGRAPAPPAPRSLYAGRRVREVLVAGGGRSTVQELRDAIAADPQARGATLPQAFAGLRHKGASVMEANDTVVLVRDTTLARQREAERQAAQTPVQEQLA